jgi:membrane associated rhomboid family serine protease
MIGAMEGRTVTLLLMAPSLAVSFLAFSRSPKGEIAERFLFMPYDVSQGFNRLGMLLSQFSHADAAHLIFNMITLYYFGPVVEAWLGPARLLLLYAACAVGSTALTYMIHRNDPGYRALGASGAITGILFAAIVLEPGMKVAFFIVPVPIPGPIFAVAYIALSILAAQRRIGNVGHEAHIGGAITGFLLGAGLSPEGFAPLLERFSRMFHR